jgi:hypothetical protein
VDPYRNTGLDEILEIKAGYDATSGDFVEARVLIQFDEINSTLNYIKSRYAPSGSISSYLILHTVQKSELPETYKIKALKVVDGWLNGSGYTTLPAGTISSTYESDGVTWKTVAGYGSTTWVDAATSSSSQISYTSSPGGGDYSGSITATASFNFKKNDNVIIDVSNIVNTWSSGSQNSGFLLKFDTTFNSSSFSQGMPTIQVYSSETHTVYEPQLLFAWNDQTYTVSSSSFTAFTDSSVIYPIVFKNSYPQGTDVRVNLGVRPRYPRKTFSQNTDFSTLSALPQTSYYQIRDAHNNEIIMPFSQFTKISSIDTSGTLQTYFNFYTGPLYPERFYRIEFKVQYNNGIIEYIDSDDFIFKVTYNDTFNGDNIIT